MTGRDQLQRVEEWLAHMKPGPQQVVVVACEHGAAGAGATAASLSATPLSEVAAATVRDAGAAARGAMRALDAAPTAAVFGQQLVFSVPCAGNLHTSVVEYIVRAGVGAALLVACPPRDCWSREGPKWLMERMYEDREAELQPRVDRRRVPVVNAAPGEEWRVHEEIAALERVLARLDAAEAEEQILIDTACELDESGQPIEVRR
jgi:coenzyme F420-reducing hydrogenase delta subunit